MVGKKRGKQPKTKYGRGNPSPFPRARLTPGEPTVRTKHNPTEYNSKTIILSLRSLDSGGPFCWDLIDKDAWWGKIWPALKSIETMTWQQVMEATKGHGRGTKNHNVAIENLTKKAKDRLSKINFLEDELFSYRVQGRIRIWGIKDRAVFRIMWYDPEHQICPLASN